MLVSRFPYPLDKGDKLRAFHQLKELSKYFEVTLFALANSPIPKEHLEIVQKQCAHLVVHEQSIFQKGWNIFRSALNGNPFQVGYFYSSKGHSKIKQLLKEGEFKHIYCQLIRMTEYVKSEHQIAKTLDYQDSFSAGIQRRIDQQPFYKKWLFRSESRRLKKYESLMFDFFEHKTIISAQDRLLIRHPEAQKIICISNGIDQQFFEPVKQEKTHDFVFVGNMSYPPNIEAVAYIHSEILPKLPESTLLISGSSPSQRVKSISESTDQITLTGWVDDIRYSYASASIFLAPMMIGTGMQNKLLEAMAMGIPCITTPLANDPIGTEKNTEVIVASTPNEFISSIEQLQTDQKKYDQICEKARQFVEKHHRWEETTLELIQLIQSSEY